MSPVVLVFQTASQETVSGVPFVHQVTQEGLVAAGGVLHVLELELEGERINPVPVQHRTKGRHRLKCSTYHEMKTS